MMPVTAVAPVNLVEPGHAIEILIDRLRHLALQDGSDRLPAEPAIAFAPLQPICLHSLHELKCSSSQPVTLGGCSILRYSAIRGVPPSHCRDANLRASPACDSQL